MKKAELEEFSMEAKKRATDNLSFRVYQLRKQNISFANIAKQLGFKTASAAQYYLNRYYKNIVEQQNEDAARKGGIDTGSGA